MKHTNLLLACVLLSSASASAKPQAPSAKASKSSPKGPQMMWGQPVRGLQLGACSVFPSPFQMDTTTPFAIVVRNVGKKPMKVTYSRFAKLWLAPIVERQDKKPLSDEQRSALQTPTYSRPAPDEETLILQPWRRQPVSFVQLKMGPFNDDWAPALWWPGKYKLTYAVSFNIVTQSDYKIARQPITVKAKPLDVELLPEAPKPTPEPQPQQ